MASLVIRRGVLSFHNGRADRRDVLGGGDWPLLDEHRTMSPAATVTVRVNTAALVPQWHDRGRPFANRAFRPGETSP